MNDLPTNVADAAARDPWKKAVNIDILQHIFSNKRSENL